MSERGRTLVRVGAGAGVLLALGAAFALGRSSGGHGGDPRAAADEAATAWTCSMHPQIRQPEPGLCPLCGMDLVPAGSGEGSADPTRVTMSERAMALARVRTAEVRRQHTEGAGARLLGRVEVDERTLTTVTAWIAGRIDRLHVTVTGQRVRRGQVIATLFSPEVYAAHQELLVARRQVERLAGASELARTGAEAAREAARQRLVLLGVPEAEVERMERASAPTRQVAIRSPFGGTVMERLATEGAYVETGAPLYRVANLDRLWMQLEAYESDLARLDVGQRVELRVEARPGEVYEGRVAFIDPVVDRERRTARVRVEVSSVDGRLRPGMFAEATLQALEPGEAASAPLVVPASAPLFTGRRSIVYVQVPDAERPTYEARVVRLGPRVGDHYPVVAGLSEGERVVIHGAFAIDADLQIRGGLSMMAGDDDTTPSPYDDVVAASAEVHAGLRTVLEPYLRLGTGLAADDLASAQQAARELGAATAAFTAPEGPARERWEPLAGELRVHAGRITEASDLEAARGPFEPLSRAITSALRIFGNPLEEPLRLAFCPMAFDDRGAEWVQTSEVIDNAYFGARMRRCGDVRATVAPGAHLAAPRGPSR